MSAPRDVGHARPRGAFDVACTLLATGLGSGFSPIVPGTAGSAVGLALLWPIQAYAPRLVPWLLLAIGVVGTVAATRVAWRVGQKDPGIVVVDEIAGMWMTLLFLPLTPLTAVAGFLLFRLMDVVKPWPARQLEALPGGWGIMADDLASGVYAHLALRVLLRVLAP